MNREEQLKNISLTEHWDIVIIGGGATGLGAALDSASRGFKTLCVEKFDFSKGTSSRSTKLIHGGVRYLEQGNFNMVKSALYERWFLLKNAPEVTHRIPFILPVYSWFKFAYYGFGLMLYDFLSGKLSIGKTKFLSKKAVVESIPQIKQDSLKGGIQYFDGQFDDSQICISLAKTAISKGATVINYMEAAEFLYSGAKIKGVKLYDHLSQSEIYVTTKVVINATGVFADSIIRKDETDHQNIVTPSQGIHLVVNKEHYNANHALLIPKTTDGRILFAVPWYDKVVIGTTDTKIQEISVEPKPTSSEIEFVINNFNQYTNSNIHQSDIKSVFAGLRPLVRMKNKQSTADLLRDHTIYVGQSGLVTITGGKWTTYRKMSRDVINMAIKSGGLAFRRCRTKKIKLITTQEVIESHNVEILHASYPFSNIDIIRAVRFEMACSLEDILARRLRLLFLDVESALEIAPKVAKIMQLELKKDEIWVYKQVADFKKLAKNYLPTIKS